jgi:hypothetical protein
MKDAVTAYDASAVNGITLHARTDGPIQGMGPQRILLHGLEGEASVPAGAINASALDMAAWMKVQLAQGKLPDGTRLYSQEQAAEMWKPQVVASTDSFGSASAVLAAISPAFQDYGLGWFIENYHGHTVVEHTGAVLGAVAALYLIPEKNVGIAVMINSEDGAARRAVAFHLVDQYLGIPDQHWNEKLKALVDKMDSSALTALKSQPEQLTPNNYSSLPIASYAGVYADPWYGTATITARPDGTLRMRFDLTPNMEGPLSHVADDTFEAKWTNKMIEPAYVTFEVHNGKILGAVMRPVSPLADFSFDYQDLHFAPR